jgi:hypothetical protein
MGAVAGWVAGAGGVDAHLGGRRNHEELLWTLLNLEIWHRACLRP